MLQFKRLTALVLAAVMALSLAGCGGGDTALRRPETDAPTLQQHQRPATPRPTVPHAPEPDTTEPAAPQVLPMSAPAAEPDRDSLEQIAQLVTGTQEDFEDLTDSELTDLIEDQLDQSTPADPQEDPTPDEPVADPHENPAGYDDQGAMTLPFDQLYPELVEKEQVAFDDETLLLKLPAHMDGTVTEAMADAGVAGLELLFELEDAAWYEAYLAAGTDVPAAVEALRR